MNLYLITFQSSLNRIESVYDCHKDLFVEIEKFFTLHLVPYTEAASIPADAYRMAFIASGGVEKMVTQHFELLPYPIHLLTVDMPRHQKNILPYRIFKVELTDLENGDRGEGLYYMEKENYIK